MHTLTGRERTEVSQSDVCVGGEGNITLNRASICFTFTSQLKEENVEISMKKIMLQEKPLDIYRDCVIIDT